MNRAKAPRRSSQRSRGSLALSVLGILDPLDGPGIAYDLRKDTSHLLLLEFFRRGHATCVTDPSGMELKSGSVGTICKPARVLPSPPYFELEKPRRFFATDFDLILMRKDPPVDAAFLQTVQILSLVSKQTWVCNAPQALMKWNEKMIILQFPGKIPPSAVTADPVLIAEIAKKGGGKAVLKDLAGFGGRGTRLAVLGSSEWRRDIGAATEDGRKPVMAQAYLPEISQGEKRVFLIGGKPLGALRRIPPRGSFLANPDLGARIEPASLTAGEKKLCAELGPFLRKEGIFFAGIDLIGGRLTEINITSPGMLWEWNEADGAEHEKEIVDLFENELRSIARS